MPPNNSRKLQTDRDGVIREFRARESRIQNLEIEDKASYNKLISLRAYLEKLWAKYTEIKNELLWDEDANSPMYLDFEDDYHNLTSIVKVKIDENYRLDPNYARSPSPCASAASARSRVSQPTPALRLPEIPLPKFGGDPREWIAFRDLFQALVIDNEQSSDVSRFYHLNQSLVGEARGVIANIPITGNNFATAWNALCSRYSNPRLIAFSHLTGLDNPPRLVPDSAQSLSTFIDHCQSNITALSNLDLGVGLGELLLVHKVVSHLDRATMCQWENAIHADKNPTLNDLWGFLQRRCKILQITEAALPNAPASTNMSPRTNPSISRSPQAFEKCLKCRERHMLHQCVSFRALSADAKLRFVKDNKLCHNCMRGYVAGHKCSEGKCFHCGKKHHSLLHNSLTVTPPSHSSSRINHATVSPSSMPIIGGMPTTSPNAQLNPLSAEWHSSMQEEALNVSSPSNDSVRMPCEANVHACSATATRGCILPTAVVNVVSARGRYHAATSLIDSGSNCNLITESLLNSLEINPEKASVMIQSIGRASSTASKVAKIQVKSRYLEWSTIQNFIVVETISLPLPAVEADVSEWHLPPECELADPRFHLEKPLDLLFGASIVADINEGGIYRLSDGGPTLTQTKLGWVASGSYSRSQPEKGDVSVISNFLISNDELSNQLEKFWKLENLPDKPPLSAEEKLCEDSFRTTTTRTDQGRYQVLLPFKASPESLGNSKAQALRRFQSLEQRFGRDPELAEMYTDFMREYIQLGHMRIAPPVQQGKPHFFIPHHPVLKLDSSSTKLRAVFDGTAPTTTKVSLNDILAVGPTVQSDLMSIIMRFRTWPVALAADIQKMYRQVQVHPDHWDFQRILWRFDKTMPVEEYHLTTVTYGLASSAYLATRALNQAALDEASQTPRVQEIILNDQYVDDLLTGANSPQEAALLVQQISSALSRAGFQFHKWMSNSATVLEVIPPEQRAKNPLKPLTEGEETISKTLGLIWNADTDTLGLAVNLQKFQTMEQFTKRQVLSCISMIFDPLGLIAPIVTPAKILFQMLWKQQIDWDQFLPPELLEAWRQILKSLTQVPAIRIPRCAKATSPPRRTELHGFCDASQAAFGACLYLRTMGEDGTVSSNLICAKSKVAPCKELSISRLELCAAVLLARLTRKVSKAITLPIAATHLWTDSENVLSLLRTPPTKRVVFVSIRVIEIQDLTAHCSWKHISSALNSADVISRGTTTEALLNLPLWWHGPPCLQSSIIKFSHHSALQKNQPVESASYPIAALCVTVMHALTDVVARSSVFSKTVRITAWLLRFIRNARKLKERVAGPLSVAELEHAETLLAKSAQAETFASELQALKAGKELPHKSPLLPLTPLLHSDGLLRVGGRLSNAPLPFDMKHQIILPSNHKFTKLLIESTHRRLLHAGNQSVMSMIRQKYWVPNLRRTVRDTLRKCTLCCRARAASAQQIMGQLPSARVTPALPFENAGIDFAGPIAIRLGGPRSRTTTKAYIAIFICLATRAVHVEIVSSLTTKDFLAAFSRFTARRGLPKNMYSDNASNFRRADRELTDLAEFQANRMVQECIQTATSSSRIHWHFIPARSPHFGGIWESAIKSFKKIFRPIVGAKILSLEELQTLAAKIEAILNSRPISALSDDPDDFNYLSPGHFLIGKPLVALPQSQTAPTESCRPLSRWKHLQSLYNLLWSKWTDDYLLALQKKQKWHSASPNLKIDTVVLIKDNNLPPCAWKLGRIVEVFPGRDNKVRVVNVKTSSGIYKRAIHNLTPLPIEPDK